MTAGLEGAVGLLVGLIIGAMLYRWKGKKTEALLKAELEKARSEISKLNG